MKYLKDGSDSMRNPLTLPVIGLSAVVVVETCLLLFIVFSTHSKVSGRTDGMSLGETARTESNKSYIVETEDGKVVEEEFWETPYGKLYYPAQWKDSMDCAVSVTDMGCKAIFTGQVVDKKAEVFAIYFGEATERAFPVGVMKTEAGDEVKIYAELFDFEYDDTWNQEEINTICAMQESINHVIAKIEEQMQSADK